MATDYTPRSGSYSTLHPTPPQSAKDLDSFRPRLGRVSPEPHYRLSRLNTPLPTAALRPPSIMSRSVSAGLPFAFKNKERQLEKGKEKEKEKESEKHPVTPPDQPERPSSRFGFATLRKKRSLASLISSASETARPASSVIDLSRESSSSSSSSIKAPTISPVDETRASRTHSRTPSRQEDQDVDAVANSFAGPAFHTRHKLQVHRYQDAPYPQSYSTTVFQNEQYTYYLMRRVNPTGGPTFHDYGSRPPASALDLGCGTGVWTLDAARTWPNTQITGFDLVDVTHPTLAELSNVHFVRGNFLTRPLPFASSTFELVRLANLALCIPYDKWKLVVNEAYRVLAPGGRIELVDDQAFFPYGDPPSDEADPVREVELPPQPSTPQPSPSTPQPTVITPRAPPTPNSADLSTFFDSSDEEDEDEDEDSPTAEVASVVLERGDSDDSEGDTASTLVGDASDRGSISSTKKTHRPTSSVVDLLIVIPSPEAPSAVDIEVDSDFPLTPTPATPGSTPFTTPKPAPVAAPSIDSQPPLPTPTAATDATTAPTNALWRPKKMASMEIESIFLLMLKKEFKMHPRPSEFWHQLLAQVFGPGSLALKESYHLKLAPHRLAKSVVKPAEDASAAWQPQVQALAQKKDGAGKGMRAWMDGGKERKGKALKEKWQGEHLPLPQGLSPKAMARLGITGPGVGAGPVVKRVAPQLLELEEASEEEEDSDEEPAPAPSPNKIEFPARTWEAPSEWAAPPSHLRSEDTMTTSSSSKTITASASNKTLMSSASTQTIKQSNRPPQAPTQTPPLTPTHSRDGSSISTASAASVSSSGSGASTTVTPGVSERLAQHPGLILWPSTFIPLPPAELEMHTCSHIQTLLGCKPALAEFVASFTDPETGARTVSDEEFEEALWEYECFRRQRFNWPEAPELRLDAEVSPDFPTPATANMSFRNEHVPHSPTKETPFGRHELPHVRTFRVFGAVKAAAEAFPFPSN